MGKTLFSQDLDKGLVDEVVDSMPVLLEGIRKRLLAPTELLERLPTAGNRRFNAAIQRVHQVVDGMIAEYRRTGVDHGDLASMMLMARDEETGEGLSDDHVRGEALTMLAAGTQTTATTMAWALHILSIREDIQDRAYQEIREVLGDRAVASDDLHRLDYLRRLLSETLRLYPPAWLLSRRTAVEVSLGGHILPAGASVLFSPYAVHRDPSSYADPELFDPDRWLPERVKQIPRPAFIPFGAGNRQCLGEGFAWVEATVVLATILARWRVLPVAGQTIHKVALATLVPSRLPLIVERRQSHRRSRQRGTTGSRTATGFTVHGMGVVVVIPYQAEPWHVSNVAFHLLVQEAVALVSVPTDEVTLIAAQANHGLHLDQMGTEERVRIARLLAAAARNLRQKLLCKSAPSEWELSYAAYLPVLEMWMDGLVSEEPGNH